MKDGIAQLLVAANINFFLLLLPAPIASHQT
jgi:hypothetical protein